MKLALKHQILAAGGFDVYAGALRNATDRAANEVRLTQNIETGDGRFA
jgi:hypothetical protein